MDKKQIETLIQLIKHKRDIVFSDGLTDSEIVAIENKFNILFPPDLKAFLQTEIPISAGFVNWRQSLISQEEENVIINKLNWPLDGMLFDIQNNAFWAKNWGENPNSYEEQCKIAKKHYEKYPKLIPIYSHRYIPSTPLEVGNPIFSVYQMDIIYYGNNLATYFRNEFQLSLPKTFEIPQEPKYIEFWSDHII